MSQEKMDLSYITNGLDLEKLRTKSVFLSYGHDDFLPYARRLAEDLGKFVKKVWFDERCIRSAHKWDVEIEDGITTSDTIIAMMTKHAYRRPSGVCLNEVVYASNNGKEIVPVLVERIAIPLLLCSIQYVDVCEIYDPVTGTFREDLYCDTLKRLLICIENPGSELDGRLSALKKFLRPMDNQLEISEKTRDFVGREWLAERFRQWMADDASPAVYFLMGGPGTGKSSFSANLSMTAGEVRGIHFCKYNDKHSGTLKTIIKTLAYHLAVQLPQYCDYLEGVDMEKLVSATDAELFQILLLQPLQRLDEPGEKIALTIDGLDEMNPESLNNFLSLLENYYHSFPSWFKLVLTSRNNPLILNRLRKIRPYIIDADCAENKEDIRRYLAMKLEGVMALTDAQMEQIIAKSEGVFQYVVFLVQEIHRRGWVDFDSMELPQGLSSAYCMNFARCFPEKDSFRQVVSVLEIMCAAQEPLSGAAIRRILGDAYALKNAVSILGDYILNRGEAVMFFHKSIKDWLTNEQENVDYYVDTYSGHVRLAAWAADNIDQWEHGGYLYDFGFYHMYAAEDYQSIFQTLNEGEDVFSDSFVELLEELLATGAPTRKLFRGMKRSVRDLDYILCKAIRVFYEKGERGDYVEQILNSFSDCCDWLEDYARLMKCLLDSRLHESLDIGLKLLEVVENREIRLGIYNYIGDSYRLLGDHENAFANYQKVIDGYPERQWAEKCFVSLYNYYDLRYVKGYLREAEQAIVRLGRQVPEKSFKRYKMWRLKGNINHQAGRRLEAAECFRRSLAIAEQDHRQLYVAEANYSIAEALVGVDNEQALAHIDTAREIAKRIRSDKAYSRTWFAYVELLVAQEKWAEAVEAGKVGAELVARTGYLTGVARIRRNMALAYYKLGAYEEAMECASFAHNRFKKRDSYPAARVFAWRIILEAADKLGRLPEAIALDSLSDIPNLHEFDNLDDHIRVIRELTEKDGKA